MIRHPGQDLTAFAEGRLPEADERRVARHVSGCRQCRDDLEEIRFGIRLAEAIPPIRAPGTLWNAIERRLDRNAWAAMSPTRAAYWGRAALYATPFVLLLVSAGVAWHAIARPQLRVREATPDPTGIERAALEEHDRRVRRAADWDLRSDEIARIRRWVEETTGLSATIPDERPAEDRDALRLTGARVIRVGSARAAMIGFDVDTRPVTLVTARLSDLVDPPAEGAVSKNITFRSGAPGGYKVLTWGSDGQAYAMVSDLPAYGQRGCILCHTDPDRRALIRSMRVERD